MNYNFDKLKDVLIIMLIGRNKFDGKMLWPSCFFPDIVLITNNNPYKRVSKYVDELKITHIYDL